MGAPEPGGEKSKKLSVSHNAAHESTVMIARLSENIAFTTYKL